MLSSTFSNLSSNLSSGNSLQLHATTASVFPHVCWDEPHYYGPSMTLVSPFIGVRLCQYPLYFCFVSRVRNIDVRNGVSCCQMQVHYAMMEAWYGGSIGF